MYKNSQNPYGDGDTPEVDYEPYRNGSEVITPVDPLPESTRERRDGPEGITNAFFTDHKSPGLF